MADNGQSNAVNILGGDANLVHSAHLLHVSDADGIERVEVSEDILQQALQEASESFVDTGGTYEDGTVSIADAANGISIDGGVISTVSDGDVIYTLDHGGGGIVDDSSQDLQGLVGGQVIQDADGNFLQQVVTQGHSDGHHAIVSSATGNYLVRLQSPQQSLLHTELVTSASNHSILNSYQQLQTSSLEGSEFTLQLNSSQPQTILKANPITTQTPTIVVQSPIVNTNSACDKPLGSSSNPIRIVQQGNQYTSLQQLSSSQLSQIMQVVQQQQVMRGAETNKSSVLYNPQTQTRIVYKVIYPSELHNRNKTPSVLKASTSQRTDSDKPAPHQIYVPTDSVLVTLPNKRTYRKKKNGEDEKAEAPELSKEEKEEKKKHRPRTRSGRVSRPPRHMIKDYKHIHPVDWDEDYDDSDGGYSDFKGSSGEDDEDSTGKRRRKRDANYTSYVIGCHGKNKPWKCKECEKSYIGKAGLARHYRLIPEHGKDDENFKDGFYIMNGADDSNSMDSMPEGKPPMTPSDSTSPQTSTNSALSATASTPGDSMPKTMPLMNGNSAACNSVSSVSEGVIKIKQPVSQMAKKKTRLKEFIREFSDEDLMDIVFPRLASTITTWEFMLMKAEKGPQTRPQLIGLLQEYVQVFRKIRRLAQEQLRSALPGQPTANGMQIQISDESVAHSLGLEVGLYSIHTPPPKEDTFQYKLLKTRDASTGQSKQPQKRTLESDPAHKLYAAKKPKFDAPSTLPSGTNQSSINTKPANTSNSEETLLEHERQSDVKSKVTQESSSVSHEVVTNTTSDSYPMDNSERSSNDLRTESLVDQCNGETEENSLKCSAAESNFKSILLSDRTLLLSGSDSVSSVKFSNCLHASTSALPSTSSTNSLSHSVLRVSTQLLEQPGQQLPAQLMEPEEGDQQYLEEPLNQICEGETGFSSVKTEDLSEKTVDVNIQFYSQEDNPIVKSDPVNDDDDQTIGNDMEINNYEEMMEQPENDVDHGLDDVDRADLDTDQFLESSADQNLGDVQDPTHLDTSHLHSDVLCLNDNFVDDILTPQSNGHDQDNMLDNVHDPDDPDNDNRLILIKNPDGSIQIHRQGNQPISLETLQELLGVELDVNLINSELMDMN